MLNSRSSNSAARRRINFSQKTRTSINSLTTCETNDRLGKKGNAKGGISSRVDFAAARRPAKTEHLGVFGACGESSATPGADRRPAPPHQGELTADGIELLSSDFPLLLQMRRPRSPPVRNYHRVGYFFRLKLNSVSVSIRVFLHSPPVYARRVC